jgi:hypothetical protein
MDSRSERFFLPSSDTRVVLAAIEVNPEPAAVAPTTVNTISNSGLRSQRTGSRVASIRIALITIDR